MRGHWFGAALVAALLVVAAPGHSASKRVSGVASVIDGDTIEIHGERVRLFGIDAPESAQLCRRSDGSPWRCGQHAALALHDHIARRTVICVEDDVDRYGRMVAHCYLGSEDLSAWLVVNGWAVAFRKYSLQYLKEEDVARTARRGVWSGSFDMPWDWRSRHRHR